MDPAAIHRFAARIRGQIVIPADPAYEQARRVNYWNPRTDRRPALIVRCASSQDVARAIEFAQAHVLPVAVRAGGHSYLGWGTCDDGLLIDVAGMKRFSIDAMKRTASVEGGVLTGDFVTAAARYGLAPVSGECPTVGVAGLMLGGGLGWLSGRHGAACDHILSAQLVTASSRTTTTSATRNPELFWAVRGGGGNFGVVTALELRLHPIREVVAGTLTYRIEDARAVLGWYHEFMAMAPDDFHAELTVVTGRSLEAAVFYCGDVAASDRILQPWRTIASPVRDTVSVVAYADLHRMPPPDGSASGPLFTSVNGVYVTRLSEEVIDTILSRAEHAPDGSAIGLGHYMHGAVCRVAPEATAFELRAPHAIHVRVNAAWRNAAAGDACMAWCDDTASLLRAFSARRIYANFQSVEGPDAARSLFGRNHPRLVAIKKAYDPTNFFKRNPNVSSPPE